MSLGGATESPDDRHQAWRERREPREPMVRIVDYSSFPRTSSEPGSRVGVTRDLSRSGMCIGVEGEEQPGSLLRVTLLDVDGQPTRCATWRVVWCNSSSDGRYWLGLELVVEARSPARST